ncbi:MAG: XRE family transcriptional regulator [Candidatus Thorarchaeota archaeon]
MVRGMPALANSKMLEWARLERGYSIDEAAKKIGIDSKFLQQCEAGDSHLTFAKLRTAAKVYKRPTASFYLQKLPKPLEVPNFRRIKDRAEEPLSKELRLEIRRFYQKRKAAIELMEFAPPFDWDKLGTIGLDEDREAVGQRIRRLLEITDDFPKGYVEGKAFKHWRSKIESTGTLVFVVSGVQVEEMRGMSFAEKPFPFIAVNSKDSYRARTFSLLHEFCHILLEDSSVCDIHDAFASDEKHRSLEVFCNHVAGAALVPKDLLLATSTVRKHGSSEIWSDQELTALAGRFRVSREVILRRLLLLGRTTDGFYRAKRSNYRYPPRAGGGGGGGETSSERVFRTDGFVFTSMVLEALNRNVIAYADAARILNIKISGLASLERLVQEQR